MRNLILFLPLLVLADDGLLVKPYLQLGDPSKTEKLEAMTLVWHSTVSAGGYSVDVSPGTAASPASERVAVPGIDPHLVWTCRLTGLKAGTGFTYTLRQNGKSVFTATGRARRSAAQDSRWVIFGDIAQGTREQRQIANQVFQAKPDAVFVTGDIVYSRGRISEYREKFYPVYNADQPSGESGAPLLRSVPFVAAPGNHDTATRDLDKYPDGLAYFLYWRQPLNGPLHAAFGGLTGGPANQEAFRGAAGPRFPKASNFSFDYGNAHWTVLDSNPYADWSDPELRRWVAADLEGARGAAWKFVGFHHPGFNSSKAHFEDQQMRVLADVFEKGGVDVVFAGHVHNYQRSRPLTFQPGKFNFKDKRVVEGEFQIDRKYDGTEKTKPKGVIYIVTGGGGAGLYDPDQTGKPESWQPFTEKFFSTMHSFTVMEIGGRKAELRQVAADGTVVDRWTVAK